MQGPAPDSEPACEVSPPEPWTPQQAEQFRARWNACFAEGNAPRLRILPEPRGQQPLVVLDLEWAEDGTPRREIFGPWACAEDGSHGEAVAGFLKDWQRLAGYPVTHRATLVRVVDPGGWARDREASAET
jgi:hypothetical protein